jgi:hypothetical protein
MIGVALPMAFGACGTPDAGDARADAHEEDGDAGTAEDAADSSDVLPDTGPPGALGWSVPENVSASPTSYSDIRYQWGRSLAVDDGGTVHVVWREVSGEGADGRDLAKVVCRQRGARGWAAPQDVSTVAAGTGHPKVAVSGSDVSVVWHVHPAAPAEDFILFSTSPAGGATGTFSAPVEIASRIVVTSGNPLGEYSTTPSLAVDGDRIHVAWSDERLVAECGREVPEIHLASSADRGTTWSAPLRVSTPDCRSSWTSAIAAANGYVHVAWTDERHDPVDCGLNPGHPCREEEYYRRVGDDGTVPADPEMRLTADAPGSEAESWGPSILVARGVVHLVWYDRAGGGDFQVHYRRSDDEGASWPAGPQVIGRPAAGCRSACATVAGGAPDVHVAWFEMCGDTTSTIRHSYSLDRGATWSPVSDVTSGTGILAVHPHIAVGGGAAHVVWSENADAEIRYARSR